MTTQDTLMVVDATEKVLVDMDKHTAIDAFLDQTRHVCEHGGSLTELGRLQQLRMIVSEDRRLL
jgi:hypothetical protein